MRQLIHDVEATAALRVDIGDAESRESVPVGVGNHVHEVLCRETSLNVCYWGQTEDLERGRPQHARRWEADRAQTVLVPGLLQTAGYAECASTAGPDFVSPESVAQLVKVREERQAKISEGGTSYAAVIWEPVVINRLVPDDVYLDQLEHLLKVGKRQNVTLQILPLSAGVRAGMTYPFSSFSFDNQPTVEAVAIDNLRGASILEASDDLAAYTRAFDQLRSAALAPDASAQLIRRALRTSKED